jgi:hypothetical protein
MASLVVSLTCTEELTASVNSKGETQHEHTSKNIIVGTRKYKIVNTKS